MGKTDKRLHDRTTAPDFAERWVATFGRREGKTEAVRAAFEAHEGPKVVMRQPPLDERTPSAPS